MEFTVQRTPTPMYVGLYPNPKVPPPHKHVPTREYGMCQFDNPRPRARIGYIEFGFEFTLLHDGGEELPIPYALRFEVLGNCRTGEVEVFPQHGVEGLPPSRVIRAWAIALIDSAVTDHRDNPVYAHAVALWTAYRATGRFGTYQR